VVYLLEESITASTKTAKARLFEGDPFNPLIFYTDKVVKINAKNIGGSLEETVRGNGNIELTENELKGYQSRMIECVDAVTIEEARKISEGLDTDQVLQRMQGQDVHPVRERGHIRTIFYITTTEKVRSGFVVFPKHYLHLLEKVDAITISFNFCYEILSQSQKYHRNNDQILSATLFAFNQLFCFVQFC